jgi:hypothetical protein
MAGIYSAIMVKTKRITQLKSATTLYDNDSILIEQENITKKASFKLFKDTVGSGNGSGNGGGSNATAYFVGNGSNKLFSPVPGLISDDAAKCLVVVGGVVQIANLAYTVNSNAGGSLVFADEAPPAGLTVSIQSFQ